MYCSLLKVAGEKISAIKEKNLYREFVQLSGADSLSFPFFLSKTGRKVANFSSNDYLAMSRRAGAIAACFEATLHNGLGSGGSRNIGGTRGLTIALETELADLHKTEAALILNTGYLANLVAMKVAAKTLGAVIFSDAKNHASIIDGLDTSGLNVDKFIFAHNDALSLERLLLENVKPDRPAVVVFESVYSMDGDFSPLPELISVATRYGCSVFLNEVHAVGVQGMEGAGRLSCYPELRDKVDLVIGTFAKGYGTVGGYVTGKALLVDAIRSFGRGLIFTTALPPGIIAATLSNVQHLRRSDKERQRSSELSSYLKQLLHENRVPLVSDASHIISIAIGDEAVAIDLSETLLEAGFYVTPIRYPTVNRGDSRLRITVTPSHTSTLIEQFVECLTQDWNRHRLTKE